MHANDTEILADRLLNATLIGYAAEEPRAGLEQRILARLADAPTPPAWLAWRWLPVGALAVVALLALATLFPRRESTRVQSPPAAPPPAVASVPAPPDPVTAEVRPAPPRAIAPQPAAVPVRAEQFPTPGSLTEQERLLMQYLTSSPREVLVATVMRSEEPLQDLQMRDLEVPVLEVKPLPEPSGKALEN